METKHNNAEQSQEVLQLADRVARLVLARTGKAIDLNQPPFIDFLMRNQVTSIALVVLLPADGGRAVQIVYLDRNPAAGFQFPTIDPSSFETGKMQPLRQGNVRREAPKEVRHHAGDKKQPDSLRGYAATLKCLACVVDQSALSPLEQSIAGRYIHAGEFAWLCLLWLWTGEPEDRQIITVLDGRSVVLEQLRDTKDGKGPLLLSKLYELDELKTELGELYGKLQQGDGRWKRSSTRLEDFEKLGFITSVANHSKLLTDKAHIFTNWFCEATQVLASGKNQTPKSPHDTTRLEMLLNPTAKSDWNKALAGHGKLLQSAAIRNDGFAWAEALNSLLNEFGSLPQNRRDDYRSMLCTDGFPVYPLVHMTMFFGLESPLDWLAIPLGDMMDGDDSLKTHDYWPQAAAFVLALHGEPDAVEKLVTSLRPILTEVAFVESSAGIQRVLRQKDEQLENLYAGMPDVIDGLFAKSPAMKQAIAEARRFAPIDMTILLLGETGTGKTMFARYIKEQSQRADKPFEEHSIHAFAPELVESELFGHEKGAYSHAYKQKKGIIERAHDGTLFLDEIQDLEPRLQAKLLKVLEDRSFYRLDGEQQIKSNFRLIVAGSADLPERVANGGFNRALWGRINKVPIVLPPLRERQEEIIPLFQFLYARACQTVRGSANAPKLDDEIVKLLQLHNWPGNVRELLSLAEYAAQIASDDIVNRQLLSSKIALFAVPQTESSVVSTVELEKLASTTDPPLQEAMTAISVALHPTGNAKQAGNWRRHSNCNELAIIAARLRKSQPKPTWQAFVAGAGVSEPVLRDMVEYGEQLLAKMLSSGGHV